MEGRSFHQTEHKWLEALLWFLGSQRVRFVFWRWLDGWELEYMGCKIHVVILPFPCKAPWQGWQEDCVQLRSFRRCFFTEWQLFLGGIVRLGWAHSKELGRSYMALRIKLHRSCCIWIAEVSQAMMCWGHRTPVAMKAVSNRIIVVTVTELSDWFWTWVCISLSLSVVSLLNLSKVLS